MGPLIVLLVLMLICAGVACAVYVATRRRRELAAWAKSKALDFSPDKIYDMNSSFGDFKCLHDGRNRHAFNMMTGQLGGRKIIAFDYQYTTGSGKNRQRHNFSAVIVNAPLPLKPLFIRREEFFDKVTEFFGSDDIDFESAEFSRKFFVKSSDEKWAHDVINQQMMEYLLACPEFAIQFAGDHIIAWRSRPFTPGDFQAAFDLTAGILERITISET